MKMKYVKQFLPNGGILPKFIEQLYNKICIGGKSNSENVGTEEESVFL